MVLRIIIHSYCQVTKICEMLSLQPKICVNLKKNLCCNIIKMSNKLTVPRQLLTK